MADGQALPADRLTAWSPLANRIFRLLWLAQFGSNIGTWTQPVGAQWLLVGHGAVLVTLVQVASGVPVLLFALPAGVLADLADRRKLLLSAQVAMAALAGVLAVLALAGHLPNAALLAQHPVVRHTVGFRPGQARQDSPRPQPWVGPEAKALG